MAKTLLVGFQNFKKLSKVQKQCKIAKNRFFAKRSISSPKKVLNHPKLVWEGPTVTHVPGFCLLVQVVLAQNGLRAQPEFPVKMGFCSEIWTFSGFLGCFFLKVHDLKKI